MKFEYDDNKRKINKEKHGIDFVEVQNLCYKENALVVPVNNEIYGVRRCRKMRKEIMKTITAKEFDEKFDNGEDITEYLDFSNAIKLKNVKRLKIS